MNEPAFLSPTPWIPTLETFGARLALVRQAAGWTNYKMAALACGIPPETWRAWETEVKKPRDYMEAVEKIAQASGCDAVWLATGQTTNLDELRARRDSNPKPSDLWSESAAVIDLAAFRAQCSA